MPRVSGFRYSFGLNVSVWWCLVVLVVVVVVVVVVVAVVGVGGVVGGGGGGCCCCCFGFVFFFLFLTHSPHPLSSLPPSRSLLCGVINSHFSFSTL